MGSDKAASVSYGSEFPSLWAGQPYAWPRVMALSHSSSGHTFSLSSHQHTGGLGAPDPISQCVSATLSPSLAQRCSSARGRHTCREPVEYMMQYRHTATWGQGLSMLGDTTEKKYSFKSLEVTGDEVAGSPCTKVPHLQD